MNIRGFMMDSDTDAIKDICASFKDRDHVEVFEIGTLYGKSAVMWDEFLEVPHNITTVDICNGWTMAPKEVLDSFAATPEFREQCRGMQSTPEEQFDEIQENIKDRNIEFVQGKWTKDWVHDKKPNIMFYDGSHSYEETVEVLDYYYETMSPDDTIVIDDYGIGYFVGVKKAVDEFVEKNHLTLVSYVDSKIASIKLAEKNVGSIKPKFADYFFSIADMTAKLSSAKRLQVGCVIVKDNRILSIGYNGTPAGWDNECEDTLVSYDERDAHNPLDVREWTYDSNTKQYRALKTKPEVIHAEANAITKVARSSESSKGATLFCTHTPCMECAKLIYQSGIDTVYIDTEYVASKGSGKQFLIDCGVEVIQYDNA